MSTFRPYNGAFALVATLLVHFFSTSPAIAGEVILTISGKSQSDGNKINVSYDLAALQALPKTSFTTSTMWTEGPQAFDGVLLKDILEINGIDQGTISAAAINDYAIDIPVSDAVVGGPIIAYALNGAPMSLRDKGPLWIVYPYDQNADYQSEVVFSRSIWQLNRITIQQ
jgi:hypothetical protein